MNIEGIFKKLLEMKQKLHDNSNNLKICKEAIESCRYIKKLLAEKKDEMFSLEFEQKEQVAIELIALCEKVESLKKDSAKLIKFVKEQKNMAAPLKKRGRQPQSDGGAAKRVRFAKLRSKVNMNNIAPSASNPNQDFAGSEVNRSGNDRESSAPSNAAAKTENFEQEAKTEPISSPPDSPVVDRAPLPSDQLLPGTISRARDEHAKVSHSYTLVTDQFDFQEDKHTYDRMVLTNIVSSLELEKSQREQELERKQENLQTLKQKGLPVYGAEKSKEMLDTQESRDEIRDHLNASLLALEEINNLSIEIGNDTMNIDGIFKKLLEMKQKLHDNSNNLKICKEAIESCRYIKKMLAEKRDEMFSLEFEQKEQVAIELIALCEKVESLKKDSAKLIEFVKEQKNITASLKRRVRRPQSDGGAAKRVKAAK